MKKPRKKLIEVALPLDAINAAARREKSIRHGHPSTLHLWWSRKPLAAARAVIFAQMVDDPGWVPEEFPTEAEQRSERDRLFEIIEQLVKWENTSNEALLAQARDEILRSWKRACADNTRHPRAATVYLGIGIDRLADRSSAISTWDVSRTTIRNTFGKQAVQMTWDYAEANVFSNSTGNFESLLAWIPKFLLKAAVGSGAGTAFQLNAAEQSLQLGNPVISTDPPYYDNIGYADLSDFFYVWLRRSLKPTFPDLFGTLAVPKAEELVATPYRHDNKEAAEAFFMAGMAEAMKRLAEQSHPALPVTIYYAFKQSETKGKAGTASTGWETFLAAVIQAGFALTGTWPMRTELSNRMVGQRTNALASSIVLVCRRRPSDAPLATRREFLNALRSELPPALRLLQSGNIAPVDLAQAAIGPGMAVYTRYERFFARLSSYSEPKPGMQLDGNTAGWQKAA